jgi:hypothetical protein
MNFPRADEGEERRRAACGENDDRLVAIADEWDRTNLFSAPHTVDPGG